MIVSCPQTRAIYPASINAPLCSINIVKLGIFLDPLRDVANLLSFLSSDFISSFFSAPQSPDQYFPWMYHPQTMVCQQYTGGACINFSESTNNLFKGPEQRLPCSEIQLNFPSLQCTVISFTGQLYMCYSYIQSVLVCCMKAFHSQFSTLGK